MSGLPPRIGRHVSIAGGIDNAFGEAQRSGCSTMQIFLSSPRMWGMQRLEQGQRLRFIENSKVFSIAPVFVHMPYLPNLASPKGEVYKRSVEVLCETAERCGSLGIGYIVAHLGSSLGEAKERGIERVVDALQEALGKSDDVCILLENQSGHSNSVGSLLEDLALIRGAVGKKSTGFCLDTCHLFAAGYDVREVKVLEEIDRVLGFGNIELIHLNDAQYGIGSARDRHEAIGKGEIGIEGFKKFFSFRKVRGKTLIMETPQSSLESELSELALVRRLASV